MEPDIPYHSPPTITAQTKHTMRYSSTAPAPLITCTQHHPHSIPSTEVTIAGDVAPPSLALLYHCWCTHTPVPPLLVYQHPCTTTGAPTHLYHLCCTNTPVPQHPGLASHSVTIPAPHPARCHHLIPRPPGHPITLSPTGI